MPENKGRFLVVSNRLPVTLACKEKKWEAKSSSGGLVNALNPVLKNRGGFWIGWPGTFENLKISAMKEILGPLSKRSGYRFLPVLMTKEDIELFYNGFSNSVLWPLFHDFQSRCNFLPSYWDGYIAANEKFAKVVLGHASINDFIWVNDYQLIPLGSMLLEKNPELNSSFFLHIPFPSVDVFMKLPWRKEILHQLTCYSLVCFQTLRDRRNFIDCIRTFYPKAVIYGRGHVVKVNNGDRVFFVGSLPISIDYKYYSSFSSTSNVTKRARQIREEIFAEKIIVGVDRLDYSKGIPEKLRGFEKCLESHPEIRERVTLYQLVVPSRDTISEYKELKHEIELLISEINGRYSTTRWTPIIWRHGTLPESELYSIYRASDIALVTSLKDGMNLVCKEYCASKGKESGVLILSEFAGAALQLSRGALLVNPFDVNDLSDSIYRAFSMDEHEKKIRMKSMRESIRRQDVFWWVENFLRAATGKKLEDYPEQDLPSLWPGLFAISKKYFKGAV
ncbi:MAG: trehalose-6-phosphate synthase [Synergistaceae bacterium]|nr:trehalose-6-phosphate synthase [Synergistaceae bacterium]